MLGCQKSKKKASGISNRQILYEKVNICYFTYLKQRCGKKFISGNLYMLLFAILMHLTKTQCKKMSENARN